MKIAIHQPNYLPYIGFFAKAALCEIFVFYDTAQFTRGDFINRNKIRMFSLNDAIWLTLPVGKKKYEGVPISEVRIKDDTIFDKHRKTIEGVYSRAPFLDRELCDYVSTGHKFLAEHNISLIEGILQKLDIKPKLVCSSKLDIPRRCGTAGIIDIVKALNGTEYISGLGAKTYLEEKQFQRENIKLYYADYKPIRYAQLHPGFVENLSIIDAAFNIGWKALTEKLKNTEVQRR